MIYKTDIVFIRGDTVFLKTVKGEILLWSFGTGENFFWELVEKVRRRTFHKNKQYRNVRFKWAKNIRRLCAKKGQR